jgi:outer membrane protein OmpA-like peptidoglycan-associated protein
MKLSLIIILFLPFTFVWAQTTSKKAEKYYLEAQNMQAGRNFDAAVEAYRKALLADPDYPEANFELAKVYMLFREFSKAKPYLEKCISLKPDDPRYMETYLQLADFCMAEGNYEKAKSYAEKFLSFNPAPKYAAQTAKAKIIIRDCDFSMESIKKPLNFNPQPMAGNINRFLQQYFPVVSADQSTLIITGRNGYDEDIYECKKDRGYWGEIKSIDALNSQFNEGTCSISADGKVLIFTACEGFRDRAVIGKCDLFISKNVGGQWQKPQNLGKIINTVHWESQPALSADGRSLFFVSDRPGGKGKKDIWMSQLDDRGDWTSPVNLGENINTAGDEISPFLHVNNTTLFFSSDGYPGFGGYDIYKSEQNNKIWEKPVNLGYPINNFRDQVGFFVTADGKTAYYSNEESQENNIVTSIIHTSNVPEEIAPMRKSGYVKGIIKDAKTLLPLQAKVELRDVETEELISEVSSDQKNGEYLIVLTEGAEYALHVSQKGYMLKSLNFNYKDNKKGEGVVLDVVLDPIAAGTKISLNNIFFERSSYALLDKSKTELNKVVQFLQTHPDIRIEISGHTDNVGDVVANMQLSRMRAESVMDYLVKIGGIDKKRIEAKGFGETQPIAPNDSEENKAKNRRIEFKIL